jgi:hypothetical protein
MTHLLRAGFVVFTALVCSVSYSQQELSWDFPLKPGSSEWATLNSHQKKVEACQIPETVLPGLSTGKLLDICLNYPLLPDILVFNTYQEGIRNLKTNFNGAAVLLARIDAPAVIEKRYSSMKPSAIDPKWTPVQKGRHVFLITAMELLLSDDEIIRKLTTVQRSKLSAALRLKLEEKRNLPSIYGSSAEQSALYTISRLIETEQESDSPLRYSKSFRSSGDTTDPNDLPDSDFRISAYNTDADEAKGNTALTAKQAIVKTPKGSTVNAFTISEISENERVYFDDYYHKTYPGAILIDTYNGHSSTRKFNCHGYAWFMTESGNGLKKPVWIGLNNNSDDDIYTTDGSFIRVMNETYPGKVTWGNETDHSAVTTDVPGVWISKWNEFPLARHKFNDSPYGVTTFRYYASTQISGAVTDLCYWSVREFTAMDIPGAIYTWITGPGIQIVSSDRNSVKITARGFYSGYSWVEARIESPLGEGRADIQTSPRKKFWVGAPLQPTSIGSASTTICSDSPVQFDVVDDENTIPVSYRWVLGSITSTGSSKDFGYAKPQASGVRTRNAYFISSPDQEAVTLNSGSGQSLLLSILAVNSCGFSPPASQSFILHSCNEPSFMLMKVFPNPASESIEISIDDSALKGAEEFGEYEIRITDGNSRAVFAGRTSGKSLKCMIGNYQKGIYFVTVETKSGVFIEKFIKQ